jgi:hypothetical protein
MKVAVIILVVGEAVCDARACKTISADWKRNVDKDYDARKK